MPFYFSRRRIPAAGEIGRYQTGDPVEPVITTSRGKVVEPYAIRVNTTDRWRIVFDLDPKGLFRWTCVLSSAGRAAKRSPKHGCTSTCRV